MGTVSDHFPGLVALRRLLQALAVTVLLFQFRDPEYGEWFGYLNQEGKVALTIKGGPFKGEWRTERAGAAGAWGSRLPLGLPTRCPDSPRRLLPCAEVPRHVRGDAGGPAESPRPGPESRLRLSSRRLPRPARREIKLSLMHCLCACVCGIAGERWRGAGLRGPAYPDPDPCPPGAPDRPTTLTDPPRAVRGLARPLARPTPRPASRTGPTPALASAPNIGPAAARAGSAARTSGRWLGLARAAPSAAAPAIPETQLQPQLQPQPQPQSRPGHPGVRLGAQRQLTARLRLARNRVPRRRYEHPQCKGEG